MMLYCKGLADKHRKEKPAMPGLTQPWARQGPQVVGESPQEHNKTWVLAPKMKDIESGAQGHFSVQATQRVTGGAQREAGVASLWRLSPLLARQLPS